MKKLIFAFNYSGNLGIVGLFLGLFLQEYSDRYLGLDMKFWRGQGRIKMYVFSHSHDSIKLLILEEKEVISSMEQEITSTINISLSRNKEFQSIKRKCYLLPYLILCFSSEELTSLLPISFYSSYPSYYVMDCFGVSQVSESRKIVSLGVILEYKFYFPKYYICLNYRWTQWFRILSTTRKVMLLDRIFEIEWTFGGFLSEDLRDCVMVFGLRLDSTSLYNL